MDSSGIDGMEEGGQVVVGALSHSSSSSPASSIVQLSSCSSSPGLRKMKKREKSEEKGIGALETNHFMDTHDLLWPTRKEKTMGCLMCATWSTWSWRISQGGPAWRISQQSASWTTCQTVHHLSLLFWQPCLRGQWWWWQTFHSRALSFY
jgi:hypothetical protein